MDPKTIGGIPVKLMEDGVLAGDTNPVNKKAIFIQKCQNINGIQIPPSMPEKNIFGASAR